MSRNSICPVKLVGGFDVGFFAFSCAVTMSCARQYSIRQDNDPKWWCGDSSVVDCGSKAVGAVLGFSNVAV